MGGAHLSDLTSDELLAVSGGISRDARCFAGGVLAFGGILTGQPQIALWGVMFTVMNCT